MSICQFPFKRTFNLLSPWLFYIWNIYTHNTSTLPMSSTQNNLFSCFTKAALTIDSTLQGGRGGTLCVFMFFSSPKRKRMQNKISQTKNWSMLLLNQVECMCYRVRHLYNAMSFVWDSETQYWKSVARGYSVEYLMILRFLGSNNIQFDSRIVISTVILY